MNKQELNKEIEENGIYCLNVFGNEVKSIPVKRAIALIKQLDEPQPVKVPQFVAEIIEYYKGKNATLYDALREKNFNKQYNEWLMNEQDAYNKVARAWLDGYEVEKDKRYIVKMKGIVNALSFLSYHKNADIWTVTDKNNSDGHRAHHTRKELEDANFGWVFDCPGIEIEEVE